MLDFSIIIHYSCMYIQVNKYIKKMCDACSHLLKENKLSIILFAFRQYFANSPSWPWPQSFSSAS